ncbi:MAG: glycosyltransferase family 9 protein [Candidatus Omnitrophota bacterium]|nr:glycosyltransferase family 9 protein [Candidatus Omnitrophota bacterium]
MNPAQSSSDFRILIVNPFGIGDVLFSTPLIRAVRKAFPGSWIGYLCNRRTERILRNNPHLDELFIYEKDEFVQLWRTSSWRCLGDLWRLLRRIRRSRFDLALDLSLGERYGLILKLLGVRQRIGFNYRRRGRFLTERFSIDGYHDVHVVEYYRRLLHFMGIGLRETSLELAVLAEDREWTGEWLARHGLADGQPLVGIVPAGGASWGIDASFRRWSFEGFAAVGDALVERHGARVILFGEASDASICQTVARLMKHPTMDMSGQTSLGQFVSLLGRLDLVICNDGGPLHLAVSQGVKTVSIFGPVDPSVYGPSISSPSRHWTVFREDLPCRPCYHQFKLPPCPYERACLTTIEPGEVIEACEALLSDHGGPLVG